MRALAQSAFINEDDGSPFFLGFFLSSGQRCFFQRRDGRFVPFQRPPDRPLAAPTQLPQNFSKHARGGSARHTRARSSPPRAAQSTSWSRIRAPQDRASVLPRCAATRRHPAAACVPRARLSSNRLALPVPPAWPSDAPSAGARPALRATSAWLFPCCNKLAARRRRASSASKSRFTPRGLPMPAKLYQTSAYVNYIMRDSIEALLLKVIKPAPSYNRIETKFVAAQKLTPSNVS